MDINKNIKKFAPLWLLAALHQIITSHKAYMARVSEIRWTRKKIILVWSSYPGEGVRASCNNNFLSRQLPKQKYFLERSTFIFFRLPLQKNIYASRVSLLKRNLFKEKKTLCANKDKHRMALVIQVFILSPDLCYLCSPIQFYFSVENVRQKNLSTCLHLFSTE